eukprot:403873-Rhodomonas_salina.1
MNKWRVRSATCLRACYAVCSASLAYAATTPSSDYSRALGNYKRAQGKILYEQRRAEYEAKR